MNSLLIAVIVLFIFSIIMFIAYVQLKTREIYKKYGIPVMPQELANFVDRFSDEQFDFEMVDFKIINQQWGHLLYEKNYVQPNGIWLFHIEVNGKNIVSGYEYWFKSRHSSVVTQSGYRVKSLSFFIR